MSPEPFFDTISKLDVVITGGIGAAVIAWFKVRRVAATENKATQVDDATSAVIVLLRAEVQRLSEQNTKLAAIVDDLQLQIISLHKDNNALRTDVSRMQHASQAN